jgi:hypothetical protein
LTPTKGGARYAAKIGHKRDAAGGVIGDHRDGAAGDAKPRKRATTKDQAGRQRNQGDDAD